MLGAVAAKKVVTGWFGLASGDAAEYATPSARTVDMESAQRRERR